MRNTRGEPLPQKLDRDPRPVPIVEHLPELVIDVGGERARRVAAKNSKRVGRGEIVHDMPVSFGSKPLVEVGLPFARVVPLISRRIDRERN